MLTFGQSGRVSKLEQTISEVVTARLLCDTLTPAQRKDCLESLGTVDSVILVYIDPPNELSQMVCAKLAAADGLAEDSLDLKDHWRDVEVLPYAGGMRCFLARQLLADNRGQVAEGYEIVFDFDEKDVQVTPAISKSSNHVAISGTNRYAALLGDMGIAPYCLSGSDKILVLHRMSSALSAYHMEGLASHAGDTTREAVFICAGIAAQMERLHELGLAHNDLKPENIVLQMTEAGRPIALKLIDFESMRFDGECQSALPGVVLVSQLLVQLNEAQDSKDMTLAGKALEHCRAAISDLIDSFEQGNAHHDTEENGASIALDPQILALAHRERARQHTLLYQLKSQIAAAELSLKSADDLKQLIADLLPITKSIQRPFAIPRTPEYAAPEFMQFIEASRECYKGGDAPDVSIDMQKHDVWALGMIMLSFLDMRAMQRLIKAHDAGGVNIRKIAVELDTLSHTPAVLENPNAAVLLDLARSVLVADPQRRPSMSEIAQHLEAFVAERERQLEQAHGAVSLNMSRR